eukprot:GHUV01045957.1.p1 GENE.GHUV01045957.1~~GHUV01045957.1.p1  ORF type:complete len:108 (-),score=34.14 GHUV01045957.1:572-895(-)
MLEKAASIHIASKNFSAAQPLMTQVTSAKLQLQYAKAKESGGRWADAAAAYEAAGEMRFCYNVVICVRLRIMVCFCSLSCRSNYIVAIHCGLLWAGQAQLQLLPQRM